MTLKIPSTNEHKLSAERVARVTKALVQRLIQKGVLQSPPQTTTTQTESAKPPNNEGQRRTGQSSVNLDCRPPSIYRAFRLIQGDKSEAKPAPARGPKPE